VTWIDDSAGWQPLTVAGFDPGRAGEGRFAIYVWRSDREGDDTKTKKSRQQELQERDRLTAGELWQDHGLVFASTVGTPLNANSVIRAFRIITKKAGFGEDWTPREPIDFRAAYSRLSTSRSPTRSYLGPGPPISGSQSRRRSP
jgi:hypothetical protein